jgi:hypothetical protein
VIPLRHLGIATQIRQLGGCRPSCARARRVERSVLVKQVTSSEWLSFHCIAM